MRSPSTRPTGAYVHGQDGPVVVISARVASFLLANADLNRLRDEHRGDDPEVDAQLGGLIYAAHSWRASATGSSGGSSLAGVPEPPAASESMSTGQAADALNISDRAVRLAIASGRLNAAQIDGRWRLTRHDVEAYSVDRTSSRATSGAA